MISELQKIQSLIGFSYLQGLSLNRLPVSISAQYSFNLLYLEFTLISAIGATHYNREDYVQSPTPVSLYSSCFSKIPLSSFRKIWLHQKMPFDIFTDALTLLFAFPAAALLGPLTKLAGISEGEDLKHKGLPISILCTLLIFVVFLLLHFYLHPRFNYSIAFSIFELTAICICCSLVLIPRILDFLRSHTMVMMMLYCLSAGFAVAAVSNVVYPNGRVFIPLFDGTKRVTLEFEDSGYKLSRVPTRSSIGNDYISIPESRFAKLKSIHVAGAQQGKMQLSGTLTPFGFGGFRVDILNELNPTNE